MLAFNTKLDCENRPQHWLIKRDWNRRDHGLMVPLVPEGKGNRQDHGLMILERIRYGVGTTKPWSLQKLRFLILFS